MRLQIKQEWLDAPGVREPAEAATWAHLQLLVGGTPWSEVIDERVNARRDGIYGTMLPLAEWLADSWPRLQFERRTPARASGDAYWEWLGFHSLRAGREGGAVPDVRVRLVHRDRIEHTTQAEDKVPPGVPVRFIRSGRELLPVEEVFPELGRFVQATIERLKPLGSNARVERLVQRWKSAQTGSSAELARLGLDDEVVDAATKEAIASRLAIGDREFKLAVAEASATLDPIDRLEEAQALLKTLPEPQGAGEQWAELERQFYSPSLPRPWLTGWAAATEFRNQLHLQSDEVLGPSFGQFLAERCGWDEAYQVLPLGAQIGGVNTVHLKVMQRPPLVLTSRGMKPARRFRLARALYHFLFGGRPDGNSLVVDSPLMSEDLSEANAFAAELLAPADRLRTSTPASGAWTQDLQHSVARALGVSPKVIGHQVRNRDLGFLVSE
jgi:hypothetical protein